MSQTVEEKDDTGAPDTSREAVVLMFSLRYLAAELSKNPVGAGGMNAGPVFGHPSGAV